MAQSSSQINGKVTYVSAKHIYVRFENTEGILVGDTLFIQKQLTKIPALIIDNISSISCMGRSLINGDILKGTEIIAFKRIKTEEQKDKVEDIPAEIKIEKQKDAVAVNDMILKEQSNSIKEEKEKKTEVNGRLSVSSYSNLSSKLNNYQRLKYNLSLNTSEIAGSKISTDMYLSFNQKMSDKISYQQDMKIYSLALGYQLNDKSKITLGRKLNPGMANIGAVDGLQFENVSGNFSYGALIGSRPDVYNYGFNGNLMQFGAFATHQLRKEKLNFQTTLAFFNQMNSWNTDRRFVYIQHNNQLSNELSMFASFEVDLYTRENGIAKNTFNFTGSYLSLRFKPSPKLSLSMNYDARKNIYYYETFKNFADSLYDRETRQGFRIQALYRPWKPIIWNTYFGYRLANQIDAASMNAHTSMTYSDLPVVGGSFSVRATGLQTKYIDGLILGGEYQRDVLDGKLYLSGEYQYVNYLMKSSSSRLIQHLVEFGANWRINKKWMISLDDELTFELNNQLNNRIFINLTRRF